MLMLLIAPLLRSVVLSSICLRKKSHQHLTDLTLKRLTLRQSILWNRTRLHLSTCFEVSWQLGHLPEEHFVVTAQSVGWNSLEVKWSGLAECCCVEGFSNDGPPIHQWPVARPSANQKAGWFVPTNQKARNPCSSYTSVVSGCFIRAHILNPQ